MGEIFPYLVNSEVTVRHADFPSPLPPRLWGGSYFILEGGTVFIFRHPKDFPSASPPALPNPVFSAFVDRLVPHLFHSQAFLHRPPLMLIFFPARSPVCLPFLRGTVRGKMFKTISSSLVNPSPTHILSLLGWRCNPCLIF